MSNHRREFEPALLSTKGIHSTLGDCAIEWNAEQWDDDFIAAQIQRANSWLLKVKRTEHPNPAIGSSYGLKHRVEQYQRTIKTADPYVSNGCFLMAAHRLGFTTKQIGFSPNAILNISNKGLDKIGVMHLSDGKYVKSPVF